MKKIYSEILIERKAELVWGVITNFEQYGEWNSFTPRITLRNGDLREGAEFDLDCRMTEKKILKNEHEMILTVDHSGRRLCMGTSRTRGRPGITSFRWQICEETSPGKTRVINYEEFHGPLAPIVYVLYKKKLKTAFDRYCEDLKKRAEAR